MLISKQEVAKVVMTIGEMVVMMMVGWNRLLGKTDVRRIVIDGQWVKIRCSKVVISPSSIISNNSITLNSLTMLKVMVLNSGTRNHQGLTCEDMKAPLLVGTV